MALKKKDDGAAALEITPVTADVLRVCIIGRTPLIMNRLAEKARQQLLFPPGRKTAADKASNLKHEPLAEFRSSVHRIEDDACPTLLGVPSTALKGAMRTAALEVGGTSRAQIGRLCYVPGSLIPVHGCPQVSCAVTRMADPARTPDVRTRAILPEWAMLAEIHYVQPQLKKQSVANLIAAAGILAGLGDWRPEKGSGSYGQFEIVDEDNPDFVRIVTNGGRDAQLAALNDPVAFDAETSELLAWFDVEVRRRGFKVAS